MARGITITYGFLTITVVAAFIFFFMVLQPQYGAIREQRQALAETRAQVAQQEAFLSTIDQKLQQLQVNQQHENKLSLILPADERSEDYLRIIHQISGLSGVTVGRLSNQSGSLQSQRNARVARGAASNLPTFIRPVGWEITISGTYQQFRAFLQELERSPRLVDILQIRLSRSQADPNTITGRMTTQFYQYLPPQESSL